MSDAQPRPDPDRLLAQVASAERSARRGRLKIFLGYAAGVGKTCAMLRAAHRLRAEGIDVVIGFVQPHSRRETDALATGLESVPPRIVEHGGSRFEEMDLDAALARRPRLAIVDELAHTNAPRSRHAKRWQDVEELIDAGIDCFTTLNVQHLESLNDVVAGITGVTVRETLPDRVLDDAAEIELVDLPIPELRQRLAAGKVYPAEQAERAAAGFFREGNLFALRELALRRAADRVDDQVKGYMHSHAIAGPWQVRDRVLVAVSASPLSERLVRGACRLAQGLDADWHAVHVESTRASRDTAAEQARVTATLRLAERLGARPRTIPGRDVAAALAAYAREQNVTKIVVGKPLRSRLVELFSGSLVDRVIRASGDIDVYVIRGADEELAPTPAQPDAARLDVREIGWGLLLVAAATALAFALRSAIAAANLVMLYVLVVIIAALRSRRSSAIAVAVASVLAFDFFLVRPYGRFSVDDAEYLLTFAALIVVALVTSRLNASARAQGEAAMRREAQTAALYECSRALAAAPDRDGIVAALVDQVAATFHENVAVWLPERGALVLHPRSAPFPTQVFEEAVARWVYEHARPAGRGTETLAGVRSLHVPLRRGEAACGVVGLFRPDDAPELTLDERRLFESFAAAAASALERLLLADSAAQARLLQERERVQTALLDSVSHDLRTPLASVTAALTSLRDDSELLDTATRRELVETAAAQAARLNRLVGDLLDMSRLQAGGLELRREPCDLQDLVGAALAQLAEELRGRPLAVTIAPRLPLVPLDFALACQALVNVVANAQRYSAPGRPIEVHASADVQGATIEVLDRGVGIPEGELDRVFEKFHRGSSAAAAGRDGGAGLGLSISRAIATAHGGSVAAARRADGGTVVRLRFPLRPPGTGSEALDP